MTITDTMTLSAAFASLAVSVFVAGWTVYRDVVQKPRFKVSMSPRSIIQQGQAKIGPDFYVEALNMGPIPNRIGMVFLRPGWIDRKLRKKSSAFSIADHTHPATTARAQKVEVGDSATFVFPLEADFLKNDEFKQLGVTDGFGRTHWSSKRAYRQAKKDVQNTLDNSKAQ